MARSIIEDLRFFSGPVNYHRRVDLPRCIVARVPPIILVTFIKFFTMISGDDDNRIFYR